MVFDPEAAPRQREEFLAWYGQVTQWTESHDYSDPKHAVRALQAWYRDMIEIFPAMNGPDAVAIDDPRLETDYVTDYCCASTAIYATFRWTLQEEAYRHVLMYAGKHRVGFYDVSAQNGAVWLPSGTGYGVAHGGGPEDQDLVHKVAAWFKSQN